jgi:hypothetical protein
MDSAALAHGFAGERFFPATILTDDPFVADEMSLPEVGYGGVVQLHFYLDDIFPRSIGRPISEWW